jgi:CRP-like cAMP-binding protein
LLLILSGLIARGLRVDGASSYCVEILGDGDLMRPWTFRGATASIPSQADWTVMTALELAVLDGNFLRAVARWPRLAANVLDLAVERTRSLAYFLTARQVSRLEGRILLTLWHLADRWGRVRPEGVVLELPKLTHEMLARMVAARRPSVTTSIRQLRELGLVDVESGGRWILHGDPIESLNAVR